MDTLTQVNNLAHFGHAISDPVRTQILAQLTSAPATPSQLAEAIGYSRQVISNHLSCLKGCELVKVERAGVSAVYSIISPKMTRTFKDLFAIAKDFNPNCICQHSRKNCC